MRRSALGVLALIATVGTSPGAELPASPDGAARIASSLSRYLGDLVVQAPSMVAVEPQDATSYRMTFDLAPLVRAIGVAGKPLKLDTPPQSIRLAENDDGTWRVTVEGLAPLSGVVGDDRFAFRMDGFRFDGTWDAGIFGFRTAGSEHASISRTDETARGKSTSTAGPGYATVEGAAGKGGGTTTVVGTSMTDVRTTATGEGFEVALRMSKADSVTTVDSMRVQPFAELLALWASGKEAVAAKATEARRLLVEALPIFESFDQRYAIEGLQVVAAGTEVSVGSLTTQTATSGLTKDARMMFWYEAKGVSVRSPRVPAWAGALLPTRSNLQMEVSGHDLASLSEEAVALLDVGAGAGRDERVKAVLQRLQSTPTVVSVMPTGFGNDLYGISVEGVGNVTSTERSTRLKVTMTGIDAVDGVLAGTEDAQARQMRAMLGMARAYASPGDNGALVWIVDYDGNAVSVNGRPLGR